MSPISVPENFLEQPMYITFGRNWNYWHLMVNNKKFVTFGHPKLFLPSLGPGRRLHFLWKKIKIEFLFTLVKIKILNYFSTCKIIPVSPVKTSVFTWVTCTEFAAIARHIISSFLQYSLTSVDSITHWLYIKRWR